MSQKSPSGKCGGPVLYFLCLPADRKAAGHFLLGGMEAMGERFGAVVAAAGSSTRMGGKSSKVLEELGGKPALYWSLAALAACPEVAEIVVVCREEDRGKAKEAAKGLEKPVLFVPGGQERQDSVLRGVEALSSEWDYILIHDGARPLVSPETVSRVCGDALAYGAASAAVPVKDTCKLGDPSGFVEETLDRSRLFAVQTPQAFERDLYLYAAHRARDRGLTYTDDCQLIEAAGGRVKLTVGEYRNLKLTTPEDLLAARAMMGEQSGRERHMRVGYGYDVHRLAEGRKLILGGVEIPFEKGLLGHSDADVLVHAAADALLGAAALGDIGHLFPDTDPRYAGADSLKLLGEVCRAVGEKGYSLGNLDCTLIAQKPKIAPYIEAMRKNIAAACGVEINKISVKATTEEGLGFTGSGEGMAASAVCLLEV